MEKFMKNRVEELKRAIEGHKFDLQKAQSELDKINEITPFMIVNHGGAFWKNLSITKINRKTVLLQDKEGNEYINSISRIKRRKNNPTKFTYGAQISIVPKLKGSA
tara:strand:- start:618 stop:935 length:318 start_codon:yes stop_codon:yes gene_type:complete